MQNNDTNGFKRAYKACEACRKSKGKCEITYGEDSCARCRRERKQCVFPLERSAKRRRASRPLPSEPSHSQGNVGNAVSHQRRSHVSVSSSSRASSIAHVSQPPHDESQKQSDHVPGLASSSVDQSLDQTPMMPPLNKEVAQTVVRSSNDAMGLLFSAAAEHEPAETRGEERNDGAGPATSLLEGMTPLSAPSPGRALLCHASPENLELWAHHRFVRQGWFSAREGITYVDLFFKNLSHLSPVADSYYADHRNHKRLILEEPLLCCTILMISSRYHILPGPGGTSRGDFIHQRLWKHCEHLLQRILFGMEKYSIAKTRTIGSITALLLIIEWHPRSLHFPPENDGWDSALADITDDPYKLHDRSADTHQRWREEVFEPAKRSDRMSWTLIGVACTLAHELGVFQQEDDDVDLPSFNDPLPQIRRLLFLYATQLSLRLGCTNVLPQTGSQSNMATSNNASGIQDRVSQDRDMMLTQWIGITKILKTASEMFFTATYRAGKKRVVLSKRYPTLIEHVETLLERWREDFKALNLPTLTDASHQILLVEYHYVQSFVASTAMQALVERVYERGGLDLWRDYDFLRNEYVQEFQFLTKVRDSSCKILTIATTLADQDVLQYCPVRFFLRIVAASILLLKSISLGSRDQDVAASLHILDRCIEALKNNKVDEVHLSPRYATLIARHVRRFRRSLRVQTDLGAAMTTPNTPIPNKSTLPSTTLPLDGGQASLTPAMSLFETADDGSMEAWLAQPFDPYVAPFGFDMMQPASSLNMDSLNFLWNLPGLN